MVTEFRKTFLMTCGETIKKTLEVVVIRGMCSVCKEAIGSEHVYGSEKCLCGKSWLDGGKEIWLSLVSSSLIDDIANAES